MLVFFARSFIDFGTEYEKQWAETINRMFKDCLTIEFPSGIPNVPMYGKVLYDWEKEFFFPLILKSDIVFAIPSDNVRYEKYKGKFGAGVILEIAYGLLIGKRVTGLVNDEENDRDIVRDMRLEDLEEYRKNKNINLTIRMLENDMEKQRSL